MALDYKPEFVKRISGIGEEFSHRYQTNPSGASDYLRTQIRDVWTENLPRPVAWLLTCLRVSTNVSPSAGYSPAQMQALSDALGMCRRYEQLTEEDVFSAVDNIEATGIGVHPTLGEKEILPFLTYAEELRTTGKTP